MDIHFKWDENVTDQIVRCEQQLYKIISTEVISEEDFDIKIIY